jgi:tetratricopeptide (TPR) repeat protein
VEAIRPNDPGNALILGSAYMRLAEYKKALPLITIALKGAGSAEGHLIMGETLLGMRNYHAAMKELKQAASLQPELPGLHTALGIGDVGLDNTQAAEAEFTAALGQDRNDFQANYYMGRLKRLDGNAAAAKKYLAAADRLHPGSAAVLFEMAAVAVSGQECPKAIPMLNKVVAQEPNQRQAHFLLARCYQRTGKSEEAKAEREIFLKLRSAQQGKTRLPDLNRENRNTASSAPGQR